MTKKSRTKSKTAGTTEITSNTTNDTQPVARRRGRPRKIRTAEELQSAQQPKLTKEQRMAIKLRKQKTYEASKQSKDSSRYYVSNAALIAEIRKCCAAAKRPEDRVMSNALAEMSMKIADKCLNHSNFRYYPIELKEDMKSFFFYKVIKGFLKNYSDKFDNPFAYLTMIAFNAYLTVIGKHYKHENIKKDLMTKMLSELESSNNFTGDSALIKNIKQYLRLTDVDNKQAEDAVSK